ncbi:MAG TPA: class I SAM-dependent methyltransferase [Verrucomicrobiae bacterium]|nr:class I SAM-dependent methyltransferase [Verrucomicrobiae bacterium]
MSLHNVSRAARWMARSLQETAWELTPAAREFRRIWPLIDGVEGLLVSPGQERWLFTTARWLPDGATIVEIGSFKGRSTCCLAYGCRGSKKHVFAIDTFAGNDSDFKEGVTFRGTGYFDVFWSNLETRGLSSYVTPWRGQSRDAAKEWMTPIDLLFIDGSHQYEDVLADFEDFFPHVKPGGIIAFHDVLPNWPGPSRVWNESARPRLRRLGCCASLAYGRKPQA